MRPGTVGVIADELSRYSAFTVSLSCLEMPPGSTVRFVLGRNIVAGCNRLTQIYEGDWLWFQGDDHVFPTDSLLRLLAHDKPVIVPLILMRQKPFLPLIFESESEHGFQAMRDIPRDSLIEVHAAGTGGMLCSREALDAIGPDPFELSSLPSGEILGEDLTLCQKFRKVGIPIYCDTSVRMGHLSTVAVWPEFTPEGVGAGLDFNSGAATG